MMAQVEIVNHFGTVDQLKLFKEWVMTPDKQMLAAAQKVSKRGKTSKEKAEEIAAEPSGEMWIIARMSAGPITVSKGIYII